MQVSGRALNFIRIIISPCTAYQPWNCAKFCPVCNIMQGAKYIAAGAHVKVRQFWMDKKSFSNCKFLSDNQILIRADTY